jgi:hypothetical protein
MRYYWPPLFCYVFFMSGRIDEQTRGDADASTEVAQRPSDAETYRTLLGVQKNITEGKLATVEAVQAVLDEMNLPAFGGPTAEIECAQFDIQRMVRVMQSIDPSLLGQPGVMECAMMWADIVENPMNLRKQRRQLRNRLEGYGLKDKSVLLGIEDDKYYELKRQGKIEEAKKLLQAIRNKATSVIDYKEKRGPSWQYTRVQQLRAIMAGVTRKGFDPSMEPKPLWSLPITAEEIGMTPEDNALIATSTSFKG